MNPPARKKTCLHLVVHSSPRAMDNCLVQADEGDAVLFLDDGVMHLVNDISRSFRPPFTECCFSAVDLEARGLSGLAQAAGAVTLTDSKIAGLLQTHDFCLTWK
jgi:sulfur relay protein TusB/DsrH